MDTPTGKAIRRLGNRWPIAGPLIREEGAKGLCGTSEPAAVQPLITALNDRNRKVRDTALLALNNLKGDAINRLCALWADGRDKRLETIIVDAGYTASHPPQLQALTTFLKGRDLDILLNEKNLHACLSDHNEKIVLGARDYVIGNKGRHSDEYVMNFLRANPESKVLQMFYTRGWNPEEPSARCLFYFLAGDLERYREVDFDHSRLRIWYDTGSAALKEAIASRIRKSGDTGLLVVFRTERGSRKELLDEKEVSLQIELLGRNREYDELFRQLRNANFEQGVLIINTLKKGGWRHPDSNTADLLARLESVLTEPGGSKGPLPFSTPICRDFRPMFLGDEGHPADEAGLIAWARDKGNFRRRSAAVVLLAEKGSAGLTDPVNAACADPYWQVRMAAACAEMLRPGILSPANRALLENDHVYWVQAVLKTAKGGRLSELGPEGIDRLKERTALSERSRKPAGPDDFLTRLKGLIPDAEREYLLTLAEYLMRDVAVTEELAYEAGETDIEIETE